MSWAIAVAPVKVRLDFVSPDSNCCEDLTGTVAVDSSALILRAPLDKLELADALAVLRTLVLAISPG